MGALQSVSAEFRGQKVMTQKFSTTSHPNGGDGN